MTPLTRGCVIHVYIYITYIYINAQLRKLQYIFYIHTLTSCLSMFSVFNIYIYVLWSQWGSEHCISYAMYMPSSPPSYCLTYVASLEGVSHFRYMERLSEEIKSRAKEPNWPWMATSRVTMLKCVLWAEVYFGGLLGWFLPKCVVKGCCSPR